MRSHITEYSFIYGRPGSSASLPMLYVRARPTPTFNSLGNSSASLAVVTVSWPSLSTRLIEHRGWISVRRHRSVFLSCYRCWWQLCRAFNCRILYDHYLPTVILIVTLIIIGIPSPTHSHSRLKSFLFCKSSLPSLSFFSFRIHYMDFPYCTLK